MDKEEMVSVKISRSAWRYVWEMKRATGYRKSIGELISTAILAGKEVKD